MKTSVRKITKQSALYTIIGLLGLLVFNKVFYSHSHINANGVTVIHAHPFQKSNGQSPSKSHHHTSFEFSTIDSFELFWFGFLGLFIGCIGFAHLKNHLIDYNNCQSTSLIAINDRAPPGLK